MKTTEILQIMNDVIASRDHLDERGDPSDIESALYMIAEYDEYVDNLLECLKQLCGPTGDGDN